MSISEIGKYTYGQRNINLIVHGPPTGPYPWSDSTVKIGSYCSIGKNIRMYINENHRYDWVSTFPFGLAKNTPFEPRCLYRDGRMSMGNGSIIIGNDVWIGEGATIMSGVTVGDGAIIAANSHVVKDVEPYSIVGGNPAKHIRYRFTQEQIKSLLEIKWWEMDDNVINKNIEYLMSGDIDKFIEKFRILK